MSIATQPTPQTTDPRRERHRCESYQTFDWFRRCTADATYAVYFIGCADPKHGADGLNPMWSCEEHAATARIDGHPDNICPCALPLTLTRITVA